MVAAVGVFASAYLLGGRRRGFPVIAGLMLAGQCGLHALFNLTQGPTAADGWVRFVGRATAAIGELAHPHVAADPAWAQMPMPPGMSMPGMPMPATGSSAAASTMAMPAMGHGLWGMLAAHLLAGLVCSWWLARGEARVFGLLLALVMAAFAPLRLTLAAFRTRALRRCGAPVEARERRTRYALALTHSVVRRGPPAWSLSL